MQRLLISSLSPLSSAAQASIESANSAPRYLDLGSLNLLLADLRRTGVKTKLRPTGMGLTADIGLCRIILGIKRVEVLIKTIKLLAGSKNTGQDHCPLSRSRSSSTPRPRWAGSRSMSCCPSPSSSGRSALSASATKSGLPNARAFGSAWPGNSRRRICPAICYWGPGLWLKKSCALREFGRINLCRVMTIAERSCHRI
jgi:hypothetical protein